LLRLSTMTCPLEAQPIRGDSLRLAQRHITTEYHPMSRLVGWHMRLYHPYDRKPRCNLFLPERSLGQGGLSPFLSRRGL
jgi:hypothetical protein